MEENQHTRHSHPSPLPSRIAALVHTHFDALPTRCKPVTREDGSREWIPMSGIVVVKGQDTPSETLTCVAVTTGAKCLPSSQIPQCRGLVLHDCHAEILALRAFNYWLLNECRSVILTGESSPLIRRRPEAAAAVVDSLWSAPCEIFPDVRIYMYCTCAPCGDASMELCMAAQEDPTPWVVATPTPEHTTGREDEKTQTLLDGRAHFSILGVVRRKPARADAESTLSKSCSDKLALRQVTSLLSYPASLLVAPTESAYLAGVILPEEEISRVACDRAFGAGPTGRMRELKGRWWRREERPDQTKYGYGYRFRPFDVLSVPTETVEALWPYGKSKAEGLSTPSSASTITPKGGKKNSNKPSNISAVWIAAPSSSSCLSSQVPSSRMRNGSDKTGVVETIINGVKQGNRAASVTARGASVLSRAKMWHLLREIVTSIPSSSPSCPPSSPGDDTPGDNIVGENDEGDTSVRYTTSMNAKDRWRTVVEAQSYEQFKRPASSPEDGCCLHLQLQLRKSAMQDAKRVLKPWIPNRGDEEWNLMDVLADPKSMNRRQKMP